MTFKLINWSDISLQCAIIDVLCRKNKIAPDIAEKAKQILANKKNEYYTSNKDLA